MLSQYYFPQGSCDRACCQAIPKNQQNCVQGHPSTLRPYGLILQKQIHYTPEEVMHRRLLQTIYRHMTGQKRVCPDEGPHWDTVGFQGNDPRTDLNRSMGIFSLIQVGEQTYLFEMHCFCTVSQRLIGWSSTLLSSLPKLAVEALQHVCRLANHCSCRKH